MWKQCLHGGIDVRHIRSVFTMALGCAHAYEMYSASSGLRGVHAEFQPPCALNLMEQIIQTWFKKRGPRRCQVRNLLLVNIDAYDLMAEFCHASSMHSA
jgi:hypothetical protein